MFKFIKSKIKLNKIYDLQFDQQVIFLTFVSEDYIESEEFGQNPHKAESFNVEFQISDDNNILRIVFVINNQNYTLDIDIRGNSAEYFANFLECLYCDKELSTTVYVSDNDNDNVDGFLMINPTECSNFINLSIITETEDGVKFADVCVDSEDFHNKFLSLLEKCEPFDKIIKGATELKKYSSKRKGINCLSRNRNDKNN